jgi:hypothetical protein
VGGFFDLLAGIEEAADPTTELSTVSGKRRKSDERDTDPCN